MKLQRVHVHFVKSTQAKMPIQQCGGITKRGERCGRSKRSEIAYYCSTHANQARPALTDGYDSDSTMRSVSEKEQEPKVAPLAPLKESFMNEKVIVKDFFDLHLKDNIGNKEYIKFLINDIESKLSKLRVALEDK